MRTKERAVTVLAALIGLAIFAMTCDSTAPHIVADRHERMERLHLVDVHPTHPCTDTDLPTLCQKVYGTAGNRPNP